MPCSIGCQNASFSEFDQAYRLLQDRSLYSVDDLAITSVQPRPTASTSRASGSSASRASEWH